METVRIQHILVFLTYILKGHAFIEIDFKS